jgi:uridine kinase
MRCETIYTPPIIIGVCGGSGSGKTTLCKALARFCPVDIALIQQDWYYKDKGQLSRSQQQKINFDCPDAIDNDLLLDHLNALKQSVSIETPEYDFTTHSRTGKFKVIHSARIILLEGIMLFAVPEIKNLCDYKIFIQVEPDIGFIRRMQRDIKIRGRSVDSVVKQYLETVKPMYNKYMLPYRDQSDIIVNGLNLQLAVKQLSEFITSIDEGNYEPENFHNYTILQPGTVFGIHHKKYFGTELSEY